jgi:hypothetical protein
MTGLSPKIFDLIAKRIRNNPNFPTINKPQYLLPFEERLFLYFVKARHNDDFPFLANIFNISVSTIKRYIDEISSFIKEAVGHEIRFPTSEEVKELRKSFPSKFPNLLAALDTSSTKWIRFYDWQRQKGTWNPHKKINALKMQLLCGLDSIVWDLSKMAHYGKRPDRWILEYENTQDKFAEIEYLAGILLDCGYTGVEKWWEEGPIWVNARKSSTKNNPEVSEYRKEHAAMRSIVERVFAQIKKWKIIGGKYNGKSVERFHDYYTAICGAWNLHVKEKQNKL